jgi:hypothetical protein
MLRNFGLGVPGFEWANLSIVYRVHFHTINPFRDLLAWGWVKQYKFVSVHSPHLSQEIATKW